MIQNLLTIRSDFFQFANGTICVFTVQSGRGEDPYKTGNGVTQTPLCCSIALCFMPKLYAAMPGSSIVLNILRFHTQ